MAKSKHFKARGELFLQVINEILCIPEHSGLSTYSELSLLAAGQPSH